MENDDSRDIPHCFLSKKPLAIDESAPSSEEVF